MNIGTRLKAANAENAHEINLLMTADLPTFPLANYEDVANFAAGKMPSISGAWHFLRSVVPESGAG